VVVDPASRYPGNGGRLGWREQRCWKKTGLNRRLWVPPDVAEAR